MYIHDLIRRSPRGHQAQTASIHNEGRDVRRIFCTAASVKLKNARAENKIRQKNEATRFH